MGVGWSWCVLFLSVLWEISSSPFTLQPTPSPFVPSPSPSISSRPNLIGNEMWFVDEYVMDIRHTVAVTHLHFDQDLYISHPFLCAYADQSCQPLREDCIPCDWSGQNVSDFV